MSSVLFLLGENPCRSRILMLFLALYVSWRLIPLIPEVAVEGGDRVIPHLKGDLRDGLAAFGEHFLGVVDADSVPVAVGGGVQHLPEKPAELGLTAMAEVAKLFDDHRFRIAGGDVFHGGQQLVEPLGADVVFLGLGAGNAVEQNQKRREQGFDHDIKIALPFGVFLIQRFNGGLHVGVVNAVDDRGAGRKIVTALQRFLQKRAFHLFGRNGDEIPAARVVFVALGKVHHAGRNTGDVPPGEAIGAVPDDEDPTAAQTKPDLHLLMVMQERNGVGGRIAGHIDVQDPVKFFFDGDDLIVVSGLWLILHNSRSSLRSFLHIMVISLYHKAS